MLSDTNKRESQVCHRSLPVTSSDADRCSTFLCRDTSSESLTRMWANAQRDGRPAEYRWRPMFNAAKLADAHYYSAVQ